MDRRSLVPRGPFHEIWAAAAGERDVSAEESSVTEQSGGSGGGRRRPREAGASVSSSAAAAEGSQRVFSTASGGGHESCVKQIGCDVKRLKIEASKDDDNGESNSGRRMGNNAKMIDQNPQPSQAPKQDYIHVRARRGQATDSHSLAERARREKISERMKILQDLVPGCNKVIGKALVLDEIINYIQSLQRQVEFLSMKLEAINAGMNLVNIEGYPAKNFVGMQTFDAIPGPAFTPQPSRDFAPGPS